MSTDRDTFVYADDYPVVMTDGLVVNVLDDPEGYLSAGDETGCEYIGVTIEDPSTDARDDLWSIGVPDYLSGMAVREVVWSVIGPDCYDLLSNVRWARDIELCERAYWAACDVVTVES